MKQISAPSRSSQKIWMLPLSKNANPIHFDRQLLSIYYVQGTQVNIWRKYIRCSLHEYKEIGVLGGWGWECMSCMGRKDGTEISSKCIATLHSPEKDRAFKIIITYNSWFQYYSLRKIAPQVGVRYWNSCIHFRTTGSTGGTWTLLNRGWQGWRSITQAHSWPTFEHLVKHAEELNDSKLIP